MSYQALARQARIEAISVHNEREIKGFFGEYRWLSNFHLCTVFYQQDKYPSSENAYQAAKAKWGARNEFKTCSPIRAKTYGKTMPLPEFWEEEKVAVMFTILRDKFGRTPLAEQLLATGDRYLEETNWWRDRFWGVFEGEGQNWLGKVIMEVRTHLQESRSR
jgi:hypothetical protein